MINPNERQKPERRSGAGLPELSNHFLSHSRRPASDLPAALHAVGCAPPGPRTGSRAPARLHLSAEAGQSTWEPHDEKALQGDGSGEPAPPGGLAHCNAIWVVFPGPSLPRFASSAGPQRGLGDTRTRRGEAVDANSGALANPAPCSPGAGSMLRWNPNCRGRWYGALTPAFIALPVPGRDRPPFALSQDAKLPAPREAASPPAAPAARKRGGAGLRLPKHCPGPEPLYPLRRCFFSVGEARSPAASDMRPERFSLWFITGEGYCNARCTVA